MAAYLETRNLSVRYGKATALREVSLGIEQGEFVALVGANGAGKTTLINALSGVVPAAAGEFWFDGARIDRVAAHQRVRLGIVQVPAGRMVMPTMTVADNLKMGAYCERNAGAVRRRLEQAYELFPRLKERKNQLGGQMSGGEQQMVAIGRALMAQPKTLLMDEPSLGLAPKIVAEVGRAIENINREGITVLLVEQNCRMALRLSTRAYILVNGKVSLEGKSAELMNDERVQKMYFGG